MPWPLLYLFMVEEEQTFKQGHLKKLDVMGEAVMKL